MGAFADELRDAMRAEDQARMTSENAPSDEDYNAALRAQGILPTGTPAEAIAMSNRSSDIRRSEALRDPGLSPADRASVRAGGAAPEGAGLPGFTAAPTPAAPGAPVMARPRAAATIGMGLGGAGGSAQNKWLAELRGAWGDQNRAIQEGADAEKLVNAGNAWSAGQRAIDAENYRADERKVAGREDADLVRREREIDEASRHLENAAPDPSRWWHSQSTGDQVRYTVAAALGGFLSGYRGGPNQALDQINKMIDRDISAQQSKIDSQRGRVKDMQGALAETYKRFGANADSRARAHAALLDQTAAEAQRLAAETNDPVVQARADQLKAQLREKAAETMFNLTRPKGTGTPALPKGNMVVPLGGGRGVVARSEQEAAALRGKVGATDAIVGNLSKLAQLEANATAADKVNPWSDYNQQRTQIIEDTLSKKALYEGQGAMSRDDAAHAEAALGALTGASRFLGNPHEAVDRAITNMRQSTDAQIRAQGGQVVQGMQAIDPTTGVPVQHWLPTGEVYEAKPGGGAPAGLPAGSAPVR